MLDDHVGNCLPVGGRRTRSLQSQLVDDSDEGTRSHRWPDGQDSDADDSPLGFGDDDRRGRNGEKLAQEADVPTLGIRLGTVDRHEANGSVEISVPSGSNVYLQARPLGCDSQRARWTAQTRIPRTPPLTPRTNWPYADELRKRIAPHARAPV